MATNLKTTPTDSPPASTGFSAQLTGASISDLIQMNCLSRTVSAFRVRSSMGLGYLCFDSGQLVHAEFGEHQGEEAVFQLLQLDSGTFQPCPNPRPTRRSISHDWQAVLLRAAQKKDEATMADDRPTTTAPRKVGISPSKTVAVNGPTLLQMPATSHKSPTKPPQKPSLSVANSGTVAAPYPDGPAPAAGYPEAQRLETQAQVATPTAPRATPGGPAAKGPTPIRAGAQTADAPPPNPALTTPMTPSDASPQDAKLSAARVSADGELLSARGPDSDSIAETTAYVTQLCAQLGKELGLGDPLSISATCEGDLAAFIYRDTSDNWVGFGGGVVDLVQIRRKVGLR